MFFANVKKDHCLSCMRYKKNSRLEKGYFGQGNKKILIIDDRLQTSQIRYDNSEYHSNSLSYIHRILAANHVNLPEDCWVSFPTHCSGESTDSALSLCTDRVFDTINDLKPKLIILLGMRAVKQVIGTRWKKNLGAIDKWSNYIIPDRELNCWIAPLASVSRVQMFEQKDVILKRKFDETISEAIRHLNIEPTFLAEDDEKFKMLNEPQSIAAMQKLLTRARDKQFWLSFDYETNTLKAYNNNSKVVTVAFCTDSKIAYSFYLTEKNKVYWKRIMESKKIDKIIHNAKFELMHTKQNIKANINGKIWDTQLATHIINNKQGITSLKFQSYVNLGIIDYSNHLSKYLVGEGSSGLNQVEQAPRKELLKYNALDALYTYYLFEDQFGTFEEEYDLRKAFNFMTETQYSLHELETVGFNIDLDYCHTEQDRLTEKIKELREELKVFETFTIWKDTYGFDMNVDSSKQTIDILYDKLGHTVTKTTEKGTPSVDNETLTKLNDPFFNKLLQIRKFEKAKNTYLDNIIKETNDDGRLHPSFSVHLVTSYRGSSQNPNFQNIPIRDAEVGPIIRNAIIPSKGNKLVEIDYGALEVRIAAVFHKDPEAIRYLMDKTTDAHTDVTCDVFMVEPSQVNKKLRAECKGSVSFLFQYGGYYVESARRIWENIAYMKLEIDGKSAYEHLATKNIHSLMDFEEHMKNFEHYYWKEKYKVYDKWKQKTYQRYCHNGYCDSPLGFRYLGPMRRNQVLNFPIQGLAAHVTFLAITKIIKYIKQKQYNSKVISTIHDSIIIDVVPSEQDDLLRECKYIMEKGVREKWKFLNVPLIAEFEATEVDEPWTNKKEIEVL